MPTRTGDADTRARKQPKQARSKQLVADVLEGAARVFDREGLDATTNRVAEEAGVSVGSLYQYFPNKQALLMALAQRHLDTAVQSIQSAMAQHITTDSLERYMRALVHAVLREHREHSHLRPLLRTVGASDAQLEQRLAACIDEARQQVVEHLRRLRPEVPNPELRARLIVAAVDGVVHTDEPLDFDQELEDEVVALCVSYLQH